MKMTNLKENTQYQKALKILKEKGTVTLEFNYQDSENEFKKVNNSTSLKTIFSIFDGEALITVQ